MLKNWHGGKPYTGYVFPTHFSSSEQKLLRQRYQEIPEEFYRTTRLPVVTPENHAAFVEGHKLLKISWGLQEQFSGSGRVPLEAVDKEFPPCSQLICVMVGI